MTPGLPNSGRPSRQSCRPRPGPQTKCGPGSRTPHRWSMPPSLRCVGSAVRRALSPAPWRRPRGRAASETAGPSSRAGAMRAAVAEPGSCARPSRPRAARTAARPLRPEVPAHVPVMVLAHAPLSRQGHTMTTGLSTGRLAPQPTSPQPPRGRPPARRSPARLGQESHRRGSSSGPLPRRAGSRRSSSHRWRR